MSGFSRIAGTGGNLPPQRLSNQDMVELLAKRNIDTSDEWIVERTGIRERHIAAVDESLTSYTLVASRQAMAQAGSNFVALSNDALASII